MREALLFEYMDRLVSNVNSMENILLELESETYSSNSRRRFLIRKFSEIGKEMLESFENFIFYGGNALVEDKPHYKIECVFFNNGISRIMTRKLREAYDYKYPDWGFTRKVEESYNIKEVEKRREGMENLIEWGIQRRGSPLIFVSECDLDFVKLICYGK